MKRKRKLFFKILAFVSIFVLGLLFAIFYLMFSSLVDVSNPNLPEISRITKLEFPENTRIVGSQRLSALNDSLYILLEMPREAVEELFPENKFHPSTTIRYLKNDNTRKRKWFNPDSISDFKSFNYTDSANNSGMYVLYDNSDAAIKKVYILWFSM